MKKITFLLLLLPALVSAHEGHGLFDAHSAMHYLLDGSHNLPLWTGAGGLALWAGTRVFRRTAAAGTKQERRRKDR
ncbi:MAG: hypothetical protein RLY31_3198 [Bacteroidota bacterium]|jgi:hypothetical protein